MILITWKFLKTASEYKINNEGGSKPNLASTLTPTVPVNQIFVNRGTPLYHVEISAIFKFSLRCHLYFIHLKLYS